MPNIEQFLHVVRAIRGDVEPPAGYVYRGMHDLLARHGQAFAVAADQSIPDRFHPWPHGCFDNAYRLARRWPDRFRYVEGLAMGVIPVHHAWTVTADGEVIDPTWARYSTIGTEYFGVVVPLDVVRRTRHPRNHCVLDNYHRRHPLLRHPWPH